MKKNMYDHGYTIGKNCVKDIGLEKALLAVEEKLSLCARYKKMTPWILGWMNAIWDENDKNCMVVYHRNTTWDFLLTSEDML